MRYLGLFIVASMAGCGPSAPGLTTTSGSGSDSETGETETTTAGTDNTTDTTNNTSDNTTRGSESESESDTGPGTSGTGGVVCTAGPPVRLTVDVMPFPNSGSVVRDWDCYVQGISESESGVSAGIGCTGGNGVMTDATLSIHGQPTPKTPSWLFAGQLLRVQHVLEQPWWTEQWIRVSIDGKPVLASSAGSSLTSGDLDPYEGFDVEMLNSGCEVPDSGCGEAVFLDASVFGGKEIVTSGTMQSLDGGYDAWLNASQFVGQINCSDTPQQWIDLALIAP